MSKAYRKFKFFSNLLLRNPLNFEKIVLFSKVYSYTMVGYWRLSNAYNLACEAEKEKIKGAFVECGVWKGGCSAVMAYEAKGDRKTWLFDSFEGLPSPIEKDGALAKTFVGKCLASQENVEEIMSKLKISRENVEIRKGWFEDILPQVKSQIGPIAILRLDGDWYESTKCCLENLYNNVVSGGYVIMDDYGHWEGSKKALNEFLEKRNLKPELIKIDYTGIYFKKPHG